MKKKLFDQFLSTGFAELNQGGERHAVSLYRHNYQALLPSDRGSRFLDIGCGTGAFLRYLGESGYNDYLGVDVSEEAIDYCRKQGLDKVKKIESLVDFLTISPQCDVVVMNDVIEHLPKAEVVTTLEKIQEKLTAGGLLFVKTGNLSSIVGARLRYQDFTHETGFTEYSLAQVLKAAGFKGILFYPYGFPLSSWRRIARFVLQRVWHLFWRLIYFIEYTPPPQVLTETFFAVARKE